MAAYRCSTCGHSWPDHSMYKKCPECENATDHVDNIEPDMDMEEARLMRLGFMFDRREKFEDTYDGLEVQARIDARFTLDAWKSEAREWEARRFAAVSPTSGVTKPRRGIHGASS